MSPLTRPILIVTLALTLLWVGYCFWFGGFLGWLPGTRLSLAYRIGLIVGGLAFSIPWAFLLIGFMEKYPDNTRKVRSIMRLRRYVIGLGAALLTLDSWQTNSNPFSDLDGMALAGLYIFVLGFLGNIYLGVYMIQKITPTTKVQHGENVYRRLDQ